MYHFVADNSTETLKLSRQVHVPGNICQYLKPFQLNGLRFLYSHYEKRESCILNDESGLGKCATTAAFLGVIGGNRKCLIVVQNDEDMVTAWQFHLNLFSTLSVGVFDTNIDCSTLTHDVYIAKWCTLKSFGDLSKHKFDYVIADNRGEMLNNAFCLGTLLKNYEKNINLFLSSTDITSDLKLLHNVLRLCGRLEPQYKCFKQFQEKFKLPHLKEVTTKNIDLEDYFLKREQLVDYCKTFRLRRYRHQFDDSLPLVDFTRYKNNLETWKTKHCNMNNSSQESSSSVEVILDSSAEKNTEELFEQYIRSQKEKSLNLEVAEILTKTTGTAIEETTEISDDPVIMSPLLFISDTDSDPDEAECTNESIEIINLDEFEEKTNVNETKTEKQNNYEIETEKHSKCETETNEVSKSKSETDKQSKCETKKHSKCKTETKEVSKSKSETDKQTKCEAQLEKDSKYEAVIEKHSKCKEAQFEKQSTFENKDREAISKDKKSVENSVQKIKAVRKSPKSKKIVAEENNTNSSPLRNLRSRIVEIREPNVKKMKDKLKKTDKKESNNESVAHTKRLTRSLIINDELTNPRSNSKTNISCETPKRQTRLSKEIPTKQSEIKATLETNKSNETPKRRNTLREREDIQRALSTPNDVQMNTNTLQKSASTKKMEQERDLRKDARFKSLQETPKRKACMTESSETPMRKLQQKSPSEKSICKPEHEKPDTVLKRNTRNVSKKLSPENNEKNEILDRVVDNVPTTPKTPANKIETNEKNAKMNEKNEKINEKNEMLDRVVENVPTTPKTPANKTTQKTVKKTSTPGCRELAIAPKGIHGRETRNMGRTTRSCGNIKNKYMRINLALDIDKRSPRRGVTSKSNEKVQNKTAQKNLKVQNINKENLKNSAKKCKDNEIAVQSDKTRPSQVPVLPMSDYVEIQCGQKLTPTLNSGSEQNLPLFPKSYDFLVPPTPSLRNSEYPTQFPPMSMNIPDSELAIVPSPTQHNADVVVLSSSQDEGSLSSHSSSLSRRTRVLKRKEIIKKPEKNTSKETKKKATFSQFLAEQNQRNAAKSPDLFSNCSDIGLTCSQTNKAFEGFKIFGSEVKQFQQQNTSSAISVPSSSRERSCLELLEKMFENRRKNLKDVPLSNNKSATEILPAVPVAPLSKPSQYTIESKKKDSLNVRQPVEEDVIFEITNNGTFGSMIRINSNGDVSPVQPQQLLKPTQHNKITNYLIGSTQTTATEDDADLPRTPSKWLSGTANTNGAMKRSPKIKQTAQTTKLTKWFSKNATSTKADVDKSPEKKDETVVPKKSPLKRRRLDLSFKK